MSGTPGRQGESPPPPRLASSLLRCLCAVIGEPWAAGDLDDLFREHYARRGKTAARRWYRYQVFSFPSRVLAARLWDLLVRFPSASRGLPAGSAGPLQRTRFVCSSIAQDLRQAMRGLIRSPGYSAVVLVTLALGIGANSAIFSVVNGVLLKSLPYQQPDRLFRLYNLNASNRWGWSVVDFQAFQEQNTSFEEFAAYAHRGMTFNAPGIAEPVFAVRVTADFFSTVTLPPRQSRVPV